ncbi:MAG TPA: DUF4266 domain-containing protein [bacterium]|jgi:hypothetical protein|nr:DUF4266 domain-containing protein [bacterium]
MKYFLKLSLLLAALSAGGCATVDIADKQDFTKPSMAFDRDRPSQAFVKHAWLVQEQADGGDGGEGGGCGCR